MLSKVRKWASASTGVPLLGKMDGRFFLGAFLLEEFLRGFSEICKITCRRVSLSLVALLGKLERFVCRDFLTEGKKYIWFPF